MAVARVHSHRSKIDHVLFSTMALPVPVEIHPVPSQLNAMIYPVLTLPPEITSNIFEHCLPKSPGLDPSCAPMLLTRVCREWSAIAVSTHRLWTSLNLAMSRDNYNAGSITDRATVDMVDMWFSRSASCLLTLRIHDNTGRLLPCEFMELLTKYSSRVEELELTCHVSISIDLTKLDFSALKRIHIEPFGWNQDDRDSWFDLSRTPKLHDVEIRRPFYSYRICLPWKQLRNVYMKNFTAGQCLELLRQAPHLPRFRCFTIDEAEGISSLSLPLNHFLHSLTLDGEVEYLLSQLTLPALCDLAFSARCYPLETLASLLSRSSCVLQRLSLHGDAVNLTETLRKLPSTPELRVETSCGCMKGSEFHDFLLRLEFDSRFLPDLKHLVLCCLYENEYSVNGYAFMVEALRALWQWRHAKRPLLSIRVSFNFNPNCLEELRSLAADGVPLTIDITSPTVPWYRAGCE